MPLVKKLSIACGVSLALVAGICFLFIQRPPGPERLSAERLLPKAPAAPDSGSGESTAASKEAASKVP